MKIATGLKIGNIASYGGRMTAYRKLKHKAIRSVCWYPLPHGWLTNPIPAGA